jgi:hypothetical protein
MRSIAPRIGGAEEHTYAEDQLEYAPIAGALVQYSDGQMHRVCRWTFTPEERRQIADGEDIYFGTPAGVRLTPHYLQVGFTAPTPPSGETT